MERYVAKEKMPEKSLKRRLCPFVKNPFDDCYCIKLDSLDVEKTLIYCSGNFEICEIYTAKAVMI